MSSGLITTYLGQGLASARPSQPDIPATAIALFFATDTGAKSLYANGAWNVIDVAASGPITASGLTQSTGKLLGRSTASTGAIEELTSVPAANFPTLTGDVTTPGASLATTVANANYSATLTATGTPPTNAIGYLGCPQNIQNASYTTLMTDVGKHLYHTSGSAHTWTIDSNANVAYPIGTILTFINENAGGVVTLAITTDTLRWTTLTGSRSLAANGTATAIKVASTTWRLTGDGIT